MMAKKQSPAESLIAGSFFNDLIKFLKETAEKGKSVMLIGPRGIGNADRGWRAP